MAADDRTQLRFVRDFGSIAVPRGTTLMAATQRAQVPLGNACRARGVCRACAVLVLSGAEHLEDPGELERRFGLEVSLGAGWRMACQTRVRGGGTVELWTPHWGGWPEAAAIE